MENKFPYIFIIQIMLNIYSSFWLITYEHFILVKQQGITAEHPTDQADANFQFGPGKRLLFAGL